MSATLEWIHEVRRPPDESLEHIQMSATMFVLRIERMYICPKCSEYKMEIIPNARDS